MTDLAYRATLRLLLWICAGNILLTNAFMLLRLPPTGAGLPLNEAVLVLALAILLFSRQSAAGFAGTLVALPLVLLWTLSGIHLVSGVVTAGAWAIRDAANLIETGFLFVGYCLASDRRFPAVFVPWLRRVLTFAAVYILFYPLRDTLSQVSPVIHSWSGYRVPLLFSYGNPASIGIIAACQLLVDRRGLRLLGLLLAAAVLATLVLFVQARITYLQLAFMLALVGLLRPGAIAGIGMLAALLVLFVGAYLASGLQVPGRLGQPFTLDFLVSHIQAIWGGGRSDTAVPAAGVTLRLQWWRAISTDLQRDPWTWLFGMGYGMPLTPFHGPDNDIVREPHNSFMSIYGRLGLVGIAAFLFLQALVVGSALRLVLRSRRPGWGNISAPALTILCFIGVHLVYSLGEGGFEVGFIAVPTYFLAGVAVALDRRLARADADAKARRIAFPGEAEEPAAEKHART